MTYEADVAADAPTYWWKMDETSGGTFANSGSEAGTGDGTYGGSLSPASENGPARFGGYWPVFGGGYVDCGNLKGYTIDWALGMTWECWYKRTGTGYARTIWSKQTGGGAGNSEYEWYVNGGFGDPNSDQLGGGVWRYSAAYSPTYVGPLTGEVDQMYQWHHFVVRITDDPTPFCSYWLDGALVIEQQAGVPPYSSTRPPTRTGALSDPGIGYPLWIGMLHPYYYPWPGALAHCAIYDYPLGQDRIEQHYGGAESSVTWSVGRIGW